MKAPLVCLLAALCVASGAAEAAFPIPGKAVRIIVGAPAGGGTDTTARLVAEQLQGLVGSPVIVENRPGAGMMLAANEVARAKADGHTLLYTPDSVLTRTPHMGEKLAYDPLKGFTPISLGAQGPIVLAMNASLPARNAKEFVAYAKTRPGQLSFASAGIGTAFHFYGELLNKQEGLGMTHVPYKGATDVMNDITSGRVQVMFAAASGAQMFAKTGKVILIGVAATKRTDLLPEVPTLREQGLAGFEIDSWLGWFGPAGMTPEDVQRLNGLLAKALTNPQVKERFRTGAYEAVTSTPQELTSMLQDGYDKWGRLIKQIGVPKQ